jgi:glycosyltransferase involved in cell wall biosynthesis/thiamine kinase-like enzyme
MDKYNILYVEGNTDKTVGGSYFSLYYLIKGLNKHVYRPYAFFYGAHSLLPQFQEQCAEVIVSPVPEKLNFQAALAGMHGWKVLYPIVAVLGAVIQKILNAFLHWVVPVFRFYRLLRRYKIDIVHLNNSIVTNHEWILAAKLARVKCVSHQRGIADSGMPVSTYLYSRLVDASISVSQAVKAHMEESGLKFKKDIVVYNALDIQEVVVRRQRDELLQAYGLGGRAPIVGIVGNIREWKGQLVVVKAIEIIKQTHPGVICLIIGGLADNQKDKLYNDQLQKYISEHELGENVLMTGYQSDVASHVNALDILIHASIEAEPFGRVILEGMALDKPIVATNIGGPIEIIEEGNNGFLVPPGDCEKLARTILYLLDNPEIMSSVAQAGKNTLLTRFNLSTHVNAIQEIYEEILKSSTISTDEKQHIINLFRRWKAISPDASLRIRKCKQPGWTSTRYIISQHESGGQKDYYLKRYTIEDTHQPYILNEWKGLQYAHKQFLNTHDFHAPEPYAFFEDQRAIIMGYVDGINMMQKTDKEMHGTLKRNISQDLAENYYNAGKMLRKFQINHSDQVEMMDGKELYGEMYLRSHDIIAALSSRGFPQDILARYAGHIDQIFQDQLSVRNDAALPVHWDFRPHNIVVDEKKQRLILLDFQLYSKKGNPYRDLASFILGLMDYYRFKFQKKEGLKILINRFLQGYTSDGEPFGEFSFDILDMVMQVRLPWHIEVAIPRKPKGLIQKMGSWILIKYYTHMMEMILKENSILRKYLKTT